MFQFQTNYYLGVEALHLRAKEVLGVAKVAMKKPDIEFMVEGHTDNVPIKIDGIQDNWEFTCATPL